MFLIIIFFLITLCSRALAESSPYIEALKKKNVEVIYCYEQHDEIILYQVKTFKNIKLTLVEKEINTANNQEPQAADFGLLLLVIDYNIF